ncbi:MAG: hypothetical protein G01um101424_208 [Parcubacteria group bacterium Gr01-1014_24]|nr:MAG: hypothetical protein G01um101424_208 [Parcubacteria group bacterium Gr01-1014_24]
MEPKPPQQPKKPEKSMEKIIWAEINAQERPSHKSEEQWTPEMRADYYMNNFYTRLPATSGKDAREHTARLGRGNRSLEQVLEDRGKKWKEWYLRPDKDEEARRKERGFSKRRWEETDDDFLKSVEQAIKETNIDKQELKEYIAMIAKDHHKHDPKKEVVLLLPLYIKLREMGYTHNDLII